MDLKLPDPAQELKKLISGVAGSAVNQKASPDEVPWRGSGLTPDSKSFFPPVSIDPDRWDKLYPYRLLVVDVTKGSRPAVVTRGGASSAVRVLSSSAPSTKGGVLTTLSFEPIGRKWQFDLPITPQNLSTTSAYSIDVGATLRGVLEEHSGMRFKNISISGTMGVWPFRPNMSAPPSSPTVLETLFGNTIEQFTGLVNQVQRVIRSVTSGHPAAKPITNGPGDSGAPSKQSTGYYHAQLLEQFVEQYAELKKRPENAGWRLVLDIPKQNQSYIVTPISLTTQQSAERPLEWRYQLQLKAWRRVELQRTGAESGVAPSAQPLTPNILQRINGALEDARRSAGAALNLIKAVRADFQGPLNTLRQVALFAKDISGATVAVGDLPRQIIGDYKSSIKQSLLVMSSSISSTSTSSDTRSSLSALLASSSIREGLSDDQVNAGSLGLAQTQLLSIDPADNIFSSPEENFDLFNQVPASQLQLSPEQQQRVDDAIEEVRTTTVDDIRSSRAEILELASQIANRFGAGNQTFSDVYGRPAPTPRVQPMTPEEFEFLASLYEAATAMDLLTANSQIDDDRRSSNTQFVDGLAEDAGFQFQTSSSKVLVPVPLGASVEEIALRYLGDAQRWLEIVTLNNLREPYIDEVGFQRPLLSNAEGRRINISSDENLFVGQKVLLRSAAQPEAARRILEIDRIAEGNVLLTLDGLPDLDIYTTFDGAYLQAYLPGTVNSQSRIWIPSDLPVDNSPRVREVPDAREDPLTGLSKVDWLLTESGDLAIGGQGEFRLAWGTQNIIQAIKIKLSTPRGKLLVHPDFGFGVRPGDSSADFDAKAAYKALAEMFESDPRFDGLDRLEVLLDGPRLKLNLSVGLANGNGVYPLSFELPAA